MEIRNRLAEIRERRGISAAKLASAVGVSRQTVYAIEGGSYVPNTAVSLRLAHIFGLRVEEIFELEGDRAPSEEYVRASLLPTPEVLQVGQPLRMCSVEDKAVAFTPEVGVHGISAFEGVLSVLHKNGKKCKVKAFENGWKDPSRILVAGCDPSVSVLANHLKSAKFELLVSYQNSRCALQLLQQGLVHLAGTHAVDQTTGRFDLARTKEMFGQTAIAAICYATWDEGLTIARGNPKIIKAVSDLKRREVTIVNREPGAASRNLLDSLLHEMRIGPDEVSGYETIAYGHLPAARKVLNGEADACISTRAAAKVFGLDFIPLARRPYHLVTLRKNLKLPAIEALLSLLGRDSFRRDVEFSAGYDMRNSGAVMV